MTEQNVENAENAENAETQRAWEVAAQRRQEARDLYVQLRAAQAVVDKWRSRLPVGFLTEWQSSIPPADQNGDDHA